MFMAVDWTYINIFKIQLFNAGFFFDISSYLICDSFVFLPHVFWSFYMFFYLFFLFIFFIYLLNFFLFIFYFLPKFLSYVFFFFFMLLPFVVFSFFSFIAGFVLSFFSFFKKKGFLSYFNSFIYFFYGYIFVDFWGYLIKFAYNQFYWVYFFFNAEFLNFKHLSTFVLVLVKDFSLRFFYLFYSQLMFIYFLRYISYLFLQSVIYLFFKIMNTLLFEFYTVYLLFLSLYILLYAGGSLLLFFFSMSLSSWNLLFKFFSLLIWPIRDNFLQNGLTTSRTLFNTFTGLLFFVYPRTLFFFSVVSFKLNAIVLNLILNFVAYLYFYLVFFFSFLINQKIFFLFFFKYLIKKLFTVLNLIVIKRNFFSYTLLILVKDFLYYFFLFFLYFFNKVFEKILNFSLLLSFSIYNIFFRLFYVLFSFVASVIGFFLRIIYYCVSSRFFWLLIILLWFNSTFFMLFLMFFNFILQEYMPVMSLWSFNIETVYPTFEDLTYFHKYVSVNIYDKPSYFLTKNLFFFIYWLFPAKLVPFFYYSIASYFSFLNFFLYELYLFFYNYFICLSCLQNFFIFLKMLHLLSVYIFFALSFNFSAYSVFFFNVFDVDIFLFASFIFLDLIHIFFFNGLFSLLLKLFAHDLQFILSYFYNVFYFLNKFFLLKINYLLDYLFFIWSFRPSFMIKDSYLKDFSFTYYTTRRRSGGNVNKLFYVFNKKKAWYEKVFIKHYFARRRFSVKVRRYFFLKTLAEVDMLHYNNAIVLTDLLLSAGRGWVTPPHFPSDTTLLIDQPFFFFNIFVFYFFWVFIFLFCVLIFKGFGILVLNSKTFIDVNFAWTSFRQDYDEQSLLLFNGILFDDEALGVYNFQLCLNIFFCQSVANVDFWQAIRKNIADSQFRGVKFYFLPGTSTTYDITFPLVHDMYLEQLVLNKTDDYLSKFIKLSEKENDFSFFQTTLKALKFYYGFMSSSDYLQYKLFYDNWEKINSFQTNYLNDFFIGPLFSNGYTSYTENNFYSGTHESLSKWFDTASLSRPLDIVIDTLVLCADVNSISTYLAAIQSLEPTEFVFAISFIDHIDSSLSEWSLYYENDIDEEELSILQVIPNVDASLLGFLSFCDEFFYFDIIDFFSAPDAIKLYDSYAGIVLSIIDETFELEDELEDAESEDEDFHYEADDEHTWFFYLKTVDTITRNFSSYLSFLDFFFLKINYLIFFFTKKVIELLCKIIF